MKIEGSYEFEAPRRLVWEMLLDPVVLGRSMPGCQALEQVGDDKYKGVVTIQVGPVQGVFQGTVRLSDRQELESYRLQVNGRGPAGMIDGLCEVRLEENGSNTILHYTGDANISGRIASVGQRVMDSSVRAITKQSLANLNGQIQARLAPEPPAPGPTQPDSAAPQQPTPATGPAAEAPAAGLGEVAVHIARELFDEFVPKAAQRWVLAGAGLLVVAILLDWWTNMVARRVAARLRQEE
jgi:carbon monoxide dehydrogenase subunit G